MLLNQFDSRLSPSLCQSMEPYGMPAIEPSLLDRIHADLNRWETPIQWMYLDSEGLVTTGCGTMLPNAEAAAAIDFFHDQSTKTATAAEKREAWSIVKTGGAAQKAAPNRQKKGAIFYKTITDLRMTLDVAVGLVDRHVMSDYAALQDIYPGFDSFPQDVKLALFDMIYNLGAGHGNSAHHRATGLRAFTTMNAAIARRDWRGAASSCTRVGPPPQRNAATSLLFLRAAGAEGQASTVRNTPAGPVAPAVYHPSPQPQRGAIKARQQRQRNVLGVLRQGSQGPEVERLQHRLNAASRHTGHALLKPDGVFGPATQRAVTAFQNRAILPVDGIVGSRTLKALGLTTGSSQ